MNEHEHRASIGLASLTLDDLAALHGGIARQMLEISERTNRCHDACVARNARVARHQLSELIKVLRLCVKFRPDYEQVIATFTERDLSPLRELIKDEAWDRVDETWAELVAAVNQAHEETNHGYLVFQLDPRRYRDLKL